MKRCKKHSTIAAVICAMLSLSASLFAQDKGTVEKTDLIPSERADLSQDGLVNRRDYILLMRILAGGVATNTPQYQRADINGDGVIDQSDAHDLVKIIECE
ncbi:MAG: hypothetical protein EOL87_03640 [Spartobacteria bacterium]|nr:hypothetical protein [Spartobacteria bacterium]